MADSQVRLTGAVAHPDRIEREFGQGGRPMVWLPRLILLIVTLMSAACHTGQVGPDPPPATEPPDEFPPGAQPAGPWAIAESFDDDTSDGAGNYLRNGYLLGWANSGFAVTTKVWLANVIIANTRALTDSP